ncbi:MAG: ArsR/SmtB family transcription factor [Francisellaceae bacterium]
MTINMIMHKLDLSQSVTSQHVQLLTEFGLIHCERKAQYRLCKINKNYARQLFESLVELF